MRTPHGYGARVNRSIFRSLAVVSLLFAVSCSGDDGDDGMIKDGRCTNDLDCAADQYCTDDTKVCAPGTGGECAMDGDCGDGRRCDTAPTDCGLSRCRPACVARTCTDVGQCDSWLCLDGTCTEPFECDAGVCPGDLECDGTTRMCVESVPETCTMDTDCATPGDICVNQMCIEPQSCTYSTDCPSDLRCIREVCREPCTSADQCADNAMFWTCDSATGECLQQCIGDQTCPAGFICEGPSGAQVCVPPQCNMDADCPGAMDRCEGEEDGRGRCVEVVPCDPMDPNACMMNFECIAGECVELPLCLGDRDCPAGRYCEDRHCQIAADCTNDPCEAGFDCIGDRCVPAVCRGDDSCPMGEVCVGGQCQTPNDGSTIANVEIITAAGSVVPTGTYRFRAVATDANGAIIPGVVFEWGSSMTDVAAIDATGLATGGNTAGTTDITASVTANMMTFSSQPVTLVNLGVSNDVRVFVVSETSGAPVDGATVDCGGSVQTSGADGVATFTVMTPVTCSVFAANHDYVTAIGLAGDATIRLPTITRTDRSTGFTGAIDFSGVTGDEPVEISFSGASFSAPLSQLSPAAFFGGNLFTYQLPVVGAVSLPAGATAAAEVMGFPFSIKDVYYSETRPGRRTAWSFAGLAGLSDLGIGGGGDLLANLLPLFQTFSHGTTGAYATLAPLPLVTDGPDIDGDGDTTEMVPDYNGFAQAPMTPATIQNLRIQISGDAASLPTNTTGLLLLSGALVPRVGFVPLGLDGLTPTGNVGSFSTTMAPPHDGLEVGAYVVIAAALDPANIGETMSAQVFVMDSLATEVDLDSGWLEFPTAGYTDMSRELTVTASGDAWRARFASPTGSWIVVGPAATTTFTLPAPPMGMDDHTASSRVFVEDLGLAGQGVNAMFPVGSNDSTQSRVVSKYSQLSVR